MKSLTDYLEEAQVFSSAATSIKGKEVAALVKLYNSGMFREGGTALDAGAGKYGRNAEWLRKQGIRTYAYDPFNGTTADGWEAVSTVMPNEKFDTGFTSYVLNVVPEEVEAQIIRDVEGRVNGTVFHITRGTDVTDMIWRTIQPGGKRNKYIMEFIEANYPEYMAKIDAGDVTKEDATALAKLGVASAKDSFQRYPDLSKYGYKRSGSGASIVWTK
ncbi:hypothetical protein VPHD479_0170 [Vibrio phage D479]